MDKPNSHITRVMTVPASNNIKSTIFLLLFNTVKICEFAFEAEPPRGATA